MPCAALALRIGRAVPSRGGLQPAWYLVEQVPAATAHPTETGDDPFVRASAECGQACGGWGGFFFFFVCPHLLPRCPRTKTYRLGCLTAMPKAAKPDPGPSPKKWRPLIAILCSKTGVHGLSLVDRLVEVQDHAAHDRGGQPARRRRATRPSSPRLVRVSCRAALGSARYLRGVAIAVAH